MSSKASWMRPLSSWRVCLHKPRPVRIQTRQLSLSTYRQPPPPPPSRAPIGIQDTEIPHTPRRIKTYPPPPSTRKICKEPLVTFVEQQLAILDPTSSRTRLFAKLNPDSAKVGDILLVRFKSGDPFSGICMNIRRRGVDTAILLRNQLTRIGTEMWVKVYSPTVTGIEVVQRAEKRARRARLFYLRKPNHDRGNLQGIVDNYIRTKSLLGGGSGPGNSKGRGNNGQKGGKGK